jgi:hypothetical protein
MDFKVELAHRPSTPHQEADPRLKEDGLMHDSDHDAELARLQQVIECQRVTLNLALEALYGLGFDLEDFAQATHD